MADQPIAHARNTDLDTSHEAAEFISPHIRELQRKVLAYAFRCGYGGFTDVALNRHFGTTSSTYRTRRSELVAKGLIVDSGERVKNPGERGRRHAVWVITHAGRKVAQS